MKPMKLFIATIAILLFAAACGDGYDRDQAFEELTTGPNALTDEQANCMLDGAEDAGLEDKVNDDELSAEDEEVLGDMIGECILGDAFTEEMDQLIDDAIDEGTADTATE